MRVSKSCSILLLACAVLCSPSLAGATPQKSQVAGAAAGYGAGIVVINALKASMPPYITE